MKSLTNNKIKIMLVAIAFLFALLCMNNVSYGASDITVKFSDNSEYTFSDFPDVSDKEYVFFKTSTDIYFFTYDKKANIFFDEDVSILGNVKPCSFYTEELKDKVFHYYPINKQNILSFAYDSLCLNYSEKPISVYSSKDIYSKKTGQVVFQKAPLKMTQLAQIVEQTQPQKKTLAEVMGILPIVIVVIVSLIGCLKALKMLLALLRNS